jgi:hypothetical protein
MKKADMVRAEMVEVTVATAKEWLSKNLSSESGSSVSNRRFKQTVSDRYFRRMERGEWNECNGETIKFDREGNLIDGQHRLDAQVRFGKTLHWLVAYNCNMKAFVTIDEGSPRGGADALSIINEKNVNVMSACIGLVLRYKAGEMDRSTSPSNAEIEQFASSSDDAAIQESVTAAIECRSPKGFLPPSSVAFLHYIGKQMHGAEMAAAFIRGACQGERTAGDQPIGVLRQKLVENLAATKRAPRIVVLAWCAKAWNAYVSGERVSKSGLRFKHRATRNNEGKVTCPSETFPTMK